MEIDLQVIGGFVLRAFVMYVFLLIVVRILGKRSIGDLSAFDFIVALAIGELIDEPIGGKEPMINGMAAIATFASLHYLISYLCYRSKKFDHFIGGAPVVLIKNGKVDEKAMRKEHIGEQELESLLRLQCIEDVEEVKEARLEPEGQLSVILKEEFQEAQKKDLEALKK